MIDYFNTSRVHALFDSTHFTVYDAITKKELLTKPGLPDSVRKSMLTELSRCRLIDLSDSITAKYSDLPLRHTSLDKGDDLNAATALVKGLPLMTRNKRHFRVVTGLTVFGERLPQPSHI